MNVRIIAAPPGEAPEEVRQAWIGLELPLAAGEKKARALFASGALVGPPTLLAKLAALLSVGTPIQPGRLVASRDVLTSLASLLVGRSARARGYLVEASQALALLTEKAPAAALWWRECAPYAWEPGRKFLFDAEVCVEVADNATGQPVASVGAPPVAAVRAGRPEWVGNEVAGALREIWLEANRTMTPWLQARPRLLVGLVVVACLLPVVVALADWFATGYAVVGPSVVAVAACLFGMVLARFVLRAWDRQIEALRRQPGPPFSKPNHAAAVFCLGFSAITCVLGLNCLTMPIRLGRPVREARLAPGEQRPGAARGRPSDGGRARHTIPWERLRGYQCEIAPISLFFGGMTGVVGLGLFSRKWPSAS